MSEEKQEQEIRFRAQKISMKERERKHISRRDFIKVATGLGLAGAGAYYFGKETLTQLGVIRPEQSTEGFFNEESERLSRATQVAETSQPGSTLEQPNIKQPENTPEPTETPELSFNWRFGDIDFSNSNEQIGMGYFIGDEEILVPYFTPISWYEGVLQSGEFGLDRNSGLTYLDERNRKILNLHSGRLSIFDQEGLTMYQLQRYIEEYPDNGVIRYAPREIDEVLRTLIGSDVVVKQENKFAYSKIIAAVRVPPERVIESRNNVYTIVSWLTENFRDSGFEQIRPNDRDVLITKFCGRKLGIEREETRETPWRQARFFIAKRLA